MLSITGSELPGEQGIDDLPPFVRNDDPGVRQADGGPRTGVELGVVLLKELRGRRQGPDQGLQLPELAIHHERKSPGGLLKMLFDLLPIMPVSGVDNDPAAASAGISRARARRIRRDRTDARRGRAPTHSPAGSGKDFPTL
ncbi:hypothetical protein ACFQY9_23740 [Microvirga aerilata]|uniref:hypothetical protein n=1 Tax=Microvirga aerilata TaxID=670292 RepID=UPI003629A813